MKDLMGSMSERQQRKFRNAMIWGSATGAFLIMMLEGEASRSGDLSAQVMCLLAGLYLMAFIAANTLPFYDGKYHLFDSYADETMEGGCME